MTPNDLIQRALKKAGVVGVGQPASAEDTNDALQDLNGLIDQWSQQRWLVYHLVDVSCPTTGQQGYSVGPGKDFDTPTPDRLEDGCFFRQLTNPPVDYPLRLISSREDYNRITLKTMGTWPGDIFYDSNWPTGTVYPWPVPSSGFEIHLLVKQVLPQFTSLAQTIVLPRGYTEALVWNLVISIRASYQLPPDPVAIAKAKVGLNLIRGANTQIPKLRMPAAVVGNGRAYNVYSDN